VKHNLNDSQLTYEETDMPQGQDTGFELDVTIVEQGPVIGDLMSSTDDGCGKTCQSACSNSTCIA
jgi:FxLD family lantipeptide